MNRLAASALLVGLSILIYGLAVQIYLRYRAHLPASIRPPTQEQRSYPLLRLGLYYFLRSLYYIGLPYLALRQGIIPANLMGLGEWTATEDEVLKTIGLMLLVFLLIALTWWNYARTLTNGNDRSSLGESGTDPMAATLEVIYLQIHWAFYRSAASLWAGGDYYSGTWLGLVLVVLEELLNPEIRRKLVRPGANLTIGIGWGIAAASGVALLFSRSLWFIAFLHLLIEMFGVVVRRKLSHRGIAGDDQTAW